MAKRPEQEVTESQVEGLIELYMKLGIPLFLLAISLVSFGRPIEGVIVAAASIPANIIRVVDFFKRRSNKST